jgi:hypothetical protein
MIGQEGAASVAAVTAFQFQLRPLYCMGVPVTVIPELTPPVSHSREVPFYANIKVIVPVVVSLGLLLGLLGVAVLIRWKSTYRQLLQTYAELCSYLR